jgi:hypothetical protein
MERSISSTMARNCGRVVSSLVMERARSSGTPELSSVESSCVKNRTSRRRPVAAKGRQLERRGLLLLEPDVDRREPLPHQLARHGLAVIGRDDAGAQLAVRGDGAVMEGRRRAIS